LKSYLIMSDIYNNNGYTMQSSERLKEVDGDTDHLEFSSSMLKSKKRD
jgi:hypothetical protein